MGQGAYDEICDGQTRDRFNKTRVMACLCLGFQPAAKDLIEPLDHKLVFSLQEYKTVPSLGVILVLWFSVRKMLLNSIIHLTHI